MSKFCSKRCYGDAKMGTPESFWARVAIKGSDDCWLWQGSVGGGGYGTIKFRGEYDYAHRVAWSLTYGAIPKDSPLEIMHTCRNEPINKLCCNPQHMALKPHKVNMEDMVAKGRAAKAWLGASGEAHPTAKLTNEQVRIIRERLSRGVPQQTIASEFGIAQSTVSRVSRGEVFPDA